MTNILTTQKEVTITSLEIAELTGKLHKNVIADIEVQLSNLGGLNFQPSNFLDTYTTSQNKQVKMYRLPKREALIVISGYDVKLRAKIIDKLEELEKKLRGEFIAPKTKLEALQLALEQEKQIQALESQLSEQAPKVAFANAYSAGANSILIRDFCKYLKQNDWNFGIGEKRFFKWLRLNGYLNQNNFPSQKSMEMGLFNVSAGTYTNSKGEAINTHTSKLTPKGQAYFFKKINEMIFVRNL